nr:esterase/lipase [uncultured bacterium]
MLIPSDGLELAVECFGEGPSLIFAHGLTGNRHFSRQQLAPLADQYTIIIYDQRGHCDSSPVTDPALYDPVRMAEDMTAVLDTLGIKKAIVGGESMGAATTLLFALRHPQRVEKLLLTAPAFGDTRSSEAAGLQQMGQRIAAIGIEAFLAESAVSQREELGWPEPVITAVAAMQGSHETHSIATACQSVIEWTLDLSPLSTIACPTCIIAWEDDPLHPLALAQRYAAEIPNARLEVLPSLAEFFSNPAIIGGIYGRFLAN